MFQSNWKTVLNQNYRVDFTLFQSSENESWSAIQLAQEINQPTNLHSS
jgi:hypothetical protein